MSFAVKVHKRLLALEDGQKAIEERLKALEAPPVMTVSHLVEAPAVSLPMEVKRGPGRPRKVVSG